MKYTCITSMHKPYYDHIGSVMLESWSKHWNSTDELIVYAEGFTETFSDERIKFVDWNETCEKNWNTYASLTKGPSLVFAKKGMAFIHAMENANCDRLVWLDADLLFSKEIDFQKFDSLLSDDKLIAFFDQYFKINPNYTIEEYIDTKNRSTYGAESGFVIVNPQHKNYNEYVQNYKNLYLNEKHPMLSNWYDTEVLVLSARDFLKEVVDLSQLRTTNKTQTPLNRCWISEYVSHQKAKSKHSYSKNDLRKIANLT